MVTRSPSTAGVMETRVVHNVHRQATQLLAQALGPAATPNPEVRELRDFVVAMLRHHHHREDTDLWPLLTAAAPELDEHLSRLTAEHQALDVALDRLATTPLQGGLSRRAWDEAVHLRDCVHDHLAHEEPILFPALVDHVPDDVWAGFSARAVASSPPEGVHLLVALLHEEGQPHELELIFRHLPEPVQAGLDANRRDGQRALARLRASARGEGDHDDDGVT